MANPLEELYQETIERILKRMTPQQRLEGMSANDVLKALPPEKREELARLLKSNGNESSPPKQAE